MWSIKSLRNNSPGVRKAGMRLAFLGRQITLYRDLYTATERLIHAFVTSKQDSYNSLLYGLPKYCIQKLQSVLNDAARLLTYTSKYDHITPVLAELHWLPVEKHIIFKILLLTYKALHSQAPTYISELLEPYKPARTLRSSSALLLKQHKYNFKN